MIKQIAALLGILAVLIVCGCTEKQATVTPTDGALSADSVRNMLPGDEQGAYIDVKGDRVNITRKMKDNFNNKMMLSGARIDTIKILQAVFKDSRISSVMVVSGISLTDKYGQTSTKAGTVYLISRATYERINWDNFLFDNLDDVADKSYVNPVLLN